MKRSHNGCACSVSPPPQQDDGYPSLAHQRSGTTVPSVKHKVTAAKTQVLVGFKAAVLKHSAPDEHLPPGSARIARVGHSAREHDGDEGEARAPTCAVDKERRRSRSSEEDRAPCALASTLPRKPEESHFQSPERPNRSPSSVTVLAPDGESEARAIAKASAHQIHLMRAAASARYVRT